MSTASPTSAGTESWQSCIECSAEFFKSLEFGRIRGIVTVSAETDKGEELVILAQELIQRDILAVIRGAGAAEVEKAELLDPSLFEQADSGLLDLCTFVGIEPVIYMHEQEADAAMLDFFKMQADLTGNEITALPFTAAASGSSVPAAVYGSVFSMEADPIKTADLVEEYIHERRLELGWHDRFYCMEAAYS